MTTTCYAPCACCVTYNPNTYTSHCLLDRREGDAPCVWSAALPIYYNDAMSLGSIIHAISTTLSATTTTCVP